MASLKSIKAVLIIRDLETGARGRLPVESCSVQYSVNQIPQAMINMPYGVSFDDLRAGSPDFPTPFPENDAGYEVKLRIANDTAAYTTDIFWGYITNVEYVEMAAYLGGGRTTRIRAEGIIGLLKQAVTRVLEGSDPDIWAGNPWFSDSIGMDWTGLVSAMANGQMSVTGGLVGGLKRICTDQINSAKGWQYQANAIGASQARWVLNNMYSTDYNFHDSNSHDINQSYDAYTRSWIADSVKEISENAPEDIWSAILLFCAMFNFAVIPTAERFFIVPFVRPAYLSAPHIYVPKCRASQVDSITTEDAQSVLTPCRTVVMSDARSPGPWNMGIGSGAFSGVNWVGGSSTKQGRADELSWPGWFPTVTSDGRTVGNLLCQQHLYDKMTGNVRVHANIPRIRSLCPGSIVRFLDFDDVPTLGMDDFVGTLLSTRFDIDAKTPRIGTNWIVSHVLDWDTYTANDEINKHPVTGTNSLTDLRYFWWDTLFSGLIF